MKYAFDYRKLGEFTYHVLHEPNTIKDYLLEWIMREWETDHNEAPEEHWTVEWINLLPKMEFNLSIVKMEIITLNNDLMSAEDFIVDLKKRTDEREESVLRGISIEPLLINRTGFELMDGYTRHAVLKRHRQIEVYAYIGST